MYNHLKKIAMTKIANLVRKCITIRTLEENLDRANELYGDKSFAEEHQDTYKSIMQFGFIPSAISVASAALVFFYIIPNIHWAIAYTIGILISSGYEVLKSWLSLKGFRAYFKGSKGLLLVAVLLAYAGSVFFSSFGAYQGYKLLEKDSTGAVLSKNSQIRDSLVIAHDRAIEDAKETAKSFHDSNLVKVKNASGQYVQVLSDRASVKNTYRDLVLSIQNAKDRKAQALGEHDNKSPNEVAQAVSDMGFYLWIVIGLSLINESVIFFFARFKEYYPYKSFIEQSAIKQPKSFSMNTDSIAKLVEMVQLGPGVQAVSSQYIPQGFSYGNTANSHDSGIGFKQKGSQTPKHSDTPQNSMKDNHSPFGMAECRHCGNEFEKSRKQHFYCSKDCNREFHKISIK